MSDKPKIAFQMRKVRIELGDIFPVRQLKNLGKGIHRYKTILVSLKEVGLVEPLVVHPQKGSPGKYLLLDGHLRYFAMKELGKSVAECIIASEDEMYTFNARVSRLPAIQEHRMIVRAVRNGVRPERIAAALNVPERVVRASMRLLDGIHEDAADLLKDKNISDKSIRLLKRVNALRQIEIAELMVSTSNYGAGYAEALVLGTPKDQLVDSEKPKEKQGMTAEEIAKLEQEMESLERDLKSIEENYGENMLNLTLARGYIKRLLENAKVIRYLNANHSEILMEFEALVAAEAL